MQISIISGLPVNRAISLRATDHLTLRSVHHGHHASEAYEQAGSKYTNISKTCTRSIRNIQTQSLSLASDQVEYIIILINYYYFDSTIICHR